MKNLMTGIDALDKKTGGFRPGEVICIAGRRSMGKTGLALSVLKRSCIEEKRPCLYFSLSEDKACLKGRLKEAFSDEKVRKAPFKIYENAFSTDEIEKVLKKRKKSKSPALVVIDHLQLIAEKGENRTYISNRIRHIARKMKCPIVVLCQLDSDIDRRKDKRPILSDLRSIGEMDHYADKVMLLFREDYYDYDTEKKNVAEVFVAKNNSGPIGAVALSHNGRGLFEDLKHSETPSIRKRGYKRTMKMTSAYANKIIRKLQEDKAFWNNKERESCTYVASVEEEPVVPDYIFSKVTAAISEIDDKIVRIKHAINVSNSTNTIIVGEKTMTIDEALIRMAQLNNRKVFLDFLRKKEPKTRCSTSYSSRRNLVPEYEYINYDLKIVGQEYDRVDTEISAIQIALDKYNLTVEFEVDY